MKISVVIATYCRPQLLSRCLLCLAQQTFDKTYYEVIVVSDGPDTATRDMVNSYQTGEFKSVRYGELALKRGPAAARNLGWKMAEGKLIAFTDDDCLPEADWLLNIWNAHEKQGKPAYTGKVVVPVSAKPTDYELNIAGLQTAEFITANCMITREALERVGGFDERYHAAWREDSDMHFKLIQQEIPVEKITNAVVVHPVRKAAWGVSVQEQKKGVYNALLYKKFPRLYRSKIARPCYNYYRILFCFIAFISCFILGFHLLAQMAFFGWFLLTAQFIYKRIKPARKSTAHFFELAITSIVIPFFSVYWTIYGAVKYRVFFI